MDYMDYSNMMNLQLFLMDEEKRLNGKKRKSNNDILDNFLGFEHPYYDENDENDENDDYDD